MTTVSLSFRPSAIDGHEGSIYYRITHFKKTCRLRSGLKIFPDEWDELRKTVTTTPKSSRRQAIIAVRDSIRHDIELISRISRRLDAEGLYFSTTDIVDEYRQYRHEYSLFNFMSVIIIKLKERGKIRTSETYLATLRSFRKFRNNKDILIDSITPEIMESYQSWLADRGICQNSISFYNRILRAVYNRALDNDLIIDRKPFRKVYTGVDKTSKRAIPIELIRRIKRLDLSMQPAADYARDMFLFSFYLRGMSFIDMAYLKKTDLRQGHITYRRRKTGQELKVEWTPEMQSLLEKYPDNETRYLLPIIRNSIMSEHICYRNASYNVNRSLKRIGRLINLHVPLTMYVARHSWATAAKSNGIPINVISEGMGHENEATTRIYLASLEPSMIDRANSIILKSLD
ncbi:MAG: site-specific integrase [Muribaculaceae bacterium]|nr:site-specific integrase [Muribaculaceae bacterium]